MGALVRTGWTVTADSDLGSPTFSPANVKDANTSTIWHSGVSSMPHNLDIDMGSATRCNLLRYIPRQSGIIRAPTSVEVYVSSDGSTWGSAIAAKSDWGTAGWGSTDTRWIDFPPTTTRYLRLKILAGTDDGYSACAELYLYDEGSGNPDIAPHDLTTSSSHSPFVVTDSSHGSSYDGFHAFDGQFNNAFKFWSSSAGPTQTLELDTGQSVTLFTYHLVCATTANRAPNTWTVQGSNDGSSWTTVDTVSGESGWTTQERRMYDCDTTTTPYRYFKIVVTAINGGSVVEIDEMYLYGAVSVSASPIAAMMRSYRQRRI